MITFKDYANRRNLSLDNFRHLQYEEYQRWCALRKVEPESRAQFESSISVFETVPDVPAYDTPDNITIEPEINIDPVECTVQVNPIDWKNLQKKRKTDIQDLCDQRGIEYSEETKRQLIQKLKQFEGIE